MKENVMYHCELKFSQNFKVLRKNPSLMIRSLAQFT